MKKKGKKWWEETSIYTHLEEEATLKTTPGSKASWRQQLSVGLFFPIWDAGPTAWFAHSDTPYFTPLIFRYTFTSLFLTNQDHVNISHTYFIHTYILSYRRK